MSIRELTLSRANRSVRLFRHAVDALASGLQPDVGEITNVGYLMRTTAVYGSGKFGLSDREVYCGRPELAAPFQAEMLTVWLIRAFSVDIVEHLAKVKGGDGAVRMAPEIRRRLGIGNSTGLGMAPFLLTHPVLIHNWIAARETALARVRAVQSFSGQQWKMLRTAIASAIANVRGWYSEHPIQVEKLGQLQADLEQIEAFVGTLDEQVETPAEAIWQWALDSLTEEGQEQLVGLLIEPFGDLVDDLADTMSADEVSSFAIEAGASVGAVAGRISRIYQWALDRDWQSSGETARLWYVSSEKLEPRLAERLDEPLEPYEQPLAPARDVAALWRDLGSFDPGAMIGEFLTQYPAHRDAVRRVQIADAHPYAEIRDNTISAKMLPIDLLRSKLSFFGATRFDPRSDRWVRITMFNDAPFPDEIATMDGDAWMYGTTDSEAPPSTPVESTKREIASSTATDSVAPDTGWSIGEIASLSVKAARGAGLSWGVAAEAGRAVRVLSAFGLPGAEALAGDLAGSKPGLTLMHGCGIAGQATASPIEIETASLVPLLLLPFLQNNLGHGKAWTVRSAVGVELFKVWRDGVRQVAPNISRKFKLVVSEDLAEQGQTPTVSRIAHVDPSALQHLKYLAAKTYAPASEHSRSAGAGAGELDND